MGPDPDRAGIGCSTYEDNYNEYHNFNVIEPSQSKRYENPRTYKYTSSNFI